jgi:hypothetical protein
MTHKRVANKDHGRTWLAAYGRLTGCSYPLQIWAHNMLATDVQSIMNVSSACLMTASLVHLGIVEHAFHRTGPTCI